MFLFHPQTPNKMIFLESPTITPHGHWSYLSKKFLHKIASELRLYAYTNAQKHIRIYVQELTIAMLKSDFLSTLGRWNSRRRIRTAVSMDMSHVRFRFSILPEPGRTGLAIGLLCYAFHYPVFFICGTHTGNPSGFLITVVCSTSIFMHNFNGLWFASFENSFNQRALR